MAKAEKLHWHEFYDELFLLYNYLLGDGGCASVLYNSSVSYLKNEHSINKRYRAVLNVRDKKGAIETQIDRIKELFYIAVEIDKKDSKDKKEPKLPVYIPRFLDDEHQIFKIQIHENKAHSSENHTKKDTVPVASCLRGSIDSESNSDNDDDKRTNRQVIDDITALLQADDYIVKVENDPENPYIMLSVDANTMCEKYECDSIQRRFDTGRQIRANFFTKKDNIVQKSKLATVGIVLLTRNVDVIHSLDRSIRTDAKYTDQHVDEIVFDYIPPKMRSGRLYKRYSEKKA